MEMLVGKKLTPEEQVRKWRQSVRKQERDLDKTIRNIDMEQTKAKKLIKEAAKRKDEKSCRILAKEIVNSNRQKDRIITSKAQLNSLIMSMQQQLGSLLLMVAVTKVTGVFQKSTETMKIVNRLMRLPEIANNMKDLSMEMMKVGGGIDPGWSD
jgi:charged multivesicular body protein 3